MPKFHSSDEKQILEGKVFAILSYLSILCIVPLALKKDNEFVLFHGKQGLVIFLGEVAIFLLQIILKPNVFKYGMFVLGIFSFIGIVNVLRGEYVKLPIVSDIAEKITL